MVKNWTGFRRRVSSPRELPSKRLIGPFRTEKLSLCSQSIPRRHPLVSTEWRPCKKNLDLLGLGWNTENSEQLGAVWPDAWGKPQQGSDGKNYSRCDKLFIFSWLGSWKWIKTAWPASRFVCRGEKKSWFGGRNTAHEVRYSNTEIPRLMYSNWTSPCTKFKGRCPRSQEGHDSNGTELSGGQKQSYIGKFLVKGFICGGKLWLKLWHP